MNNTLRTQFPYITAGFASIGKLKCSNMDCGNMTNQTITSSTMTSTTHISQTVSSSTGTFQDLNVLGNLNVSNLTFNDLTISGTLSAGTGDFSILSSTTGTIDTLTSEQITINNHFNTDTLILTQDNPSIVSKIEMLGINDSMDCYGSVQMSHNDGGDKKFFIQSINSDPNVNPISQGSVIIGQTGTDYANNSYINNPTTIVVSYGDVQINPSTDTKINSDLLVSNDLYIQSNRIIGNSSSSGSLTLPQNVLGQRGVLYCDNGIISVSNSYLSGMLMYLNYDEIGTGTYKYLSPSANSTTPSQTLDTTIPHTGSPETFIVGFSNSNPLIIGEFVPEGSWDLNVFSQVSSNNAEIYVYFKVFKRNSLGVETQIGMTGSQSLVSATYVDPADLVSSTLIVPYTDFTSTDSIVVKIYAKNIGSSDRDLRLSFLDGYYSHVHTTLQSSSLPSLTSVNSDVLPASDNTYFMGNNSYKWAQGYFTQVNSTTGSFSSSVSTTELNFNNNPITINNTNTDGIQIGNNAGSFNQASNGIAIGYQAGELNQLPNSIAIGQAAGGDSQDTNSIAIGNFAANLAQGTNSIAIGNLAGSNTQGEYSLAIGSSAGLNTQGIYSVAIGPVAAVLNQGQSSVAIGSGSGYQNQGESSISIGPSTGYLSQASNSVAIGVQAGYDGQGSSSVAIGYQSGYSNQSSNSIAIGTSAGSSLQNVNSIAIGFEAGSNLQNSNAIAIGNSAGNSNQGSNSVAIGLNAGSNRQGTGSVAIGSNSGQTSQGINSIALGTTAGSNLQSSNSIAIGNLSGQLSQLNESVAIGYGAAMSNQNSNSVAIGNIAGQSNQGTGSVAIGVSSARNSQGSQCVAIGSNSARDSQGSNSVAIGPIAAQTSQRPNCIAIGSSAGSNAQGTGAIAIGSSAAASNQSCNAISIGSNAGNLTQGSNSIAIGFLAGCNTQGSNSISIGSNSGFTIQGTNCIAIGSSAGSSLQSGNAIAIGNSAGEGGSISQRQNSNCVAIGTSAGRTSQQSNSIAIGNSAGSNNLGSNSIAIGAFAGLTNAHDRCIIINATGSTLQTQQADSLYISPIRPLSNANVLTYNTSTSEITHTAKSFIIDHPIDSERYLVHACLEGPEAGVYYRGTAEITNTHYIQIELPEYCTYWTNFTISLTQKIKHGDAPIYAQLIASEVKNCKFMVFTLNCHNCSFDYVVYAERSKIDVEPLKKDVEVKGNGPYKWI